MNLKHNFSFSGTQEVNFAISLKCVNNGMSVNATSVGLCDKKILQTKPQKKIYGIF